MNRFNKVCSVNYARQLSRAGINPLTESVYWDYPDTPKLMKSREIVSYTIYDKKLLFPAISLAEIVTIFWNYFIGIQVNVWNRPGSQTIVELYMFKLNEISHHKYTYDDVINEVDAICEMLIALIESKEIDIEHVNQIISLNHAPA